MSSGDTGDDSRSEVAVSRRRLLTSAGTAAATTVAGCKTSDDDTPPEDVPDVTLTDVRVVQTVEDSKLTDAQGELPDPPIVADEFATVVFDIETTHPQNIPEKVPVAVTTPTADFDYSQILSREQILAMNSFEDPPLVFQQAAEDDMPGEPPDVQRMPEDVGAIDVKVLPNDIDGDEVRLTEGADADFEVVPQRTLRVAFIPVKDPGAGFGQWVVHGDDQLSDSTDVVLHTTDIDWGDRDGEAKYYRQSVLASVEYLTHVFPGQVVAYKHDKHFLGNIREVTHNASTRDAEDAMRILNEIRERSSFPDDGEIITQDVDRQDAIDMMDADEGGAFDAHVMICPRGSAEGNEDYFDAHWSDDPPAGYHWHTSAAVGSQEAVATNRRYMRHVHTTAQEIGHRFAHRPYDDGSDNPFSRTADLDDDGTPDDDRNHGNGSLESTGYDLSDGNYALLNDFDLQYASFRNGWATSDTVETHTSYMSYTGGTVWADSRIHRYLIESEYDPGYTGGSSARGGSSAHASPAGAGAQVAAGRTAREVQPVIDVFGAVADGQVRFNDAATYRARPGGNEYDPEHHVDATPVEVTVEDPAGEPLASTVVPDRHVGSEGDVFTSVAASLPFPKDGARVIAERDGERTGLNPIVAPLRTALLGVPEPALTEGMATVTALVDVLAQCDEQMTAGEYRAAAATLRDEFVTGVLSGVGAYEPLANQPTAEQLVALTDRQIERLEGLAGEGPAGPITVSLPDGSTRSVEPVEDERSVAEYYGFDTEGDKSANPPDAVTVPNATVTFVYHDTTSGERSLVVIHGDPADDTEDGGAAVMRFGNVAGYEWRVQDGPPDNDAYETANGAFGATESVIWTWPAGRSDGGAFGGIGRSFDVEVVHRGEGTVNDESQERTGIDRWLFVDGSAIEDPIELATFGDGATGDVSIDVSGSS